MPISLKSPGSDAGKAFHQLAMLIAGDPESAAPGKRRRRLSFARTS
jgi:hypothetical protein